MENSRRSDTTHQPSMVSPGVVSQSPSVDQQVMDQFAQMKTMLLSFDPGRRPPEQPLATTWHLKMKIRTKVTFRNEALKLLRAGQRTGPVGPSNLHFLGAPITLQPPHYHQRQPQQPAAAAWEYILTIPETQMPASQAIQPAQPGFRGQGRCFFYHRVDTLDNS